MDIGVAKHLAALAAAVIVVDCLPNMNAESVSAKTVPLVRYLREHGHPATPIVLAESGALPSPIRVSPLVITRCPLVGNTSSLPGLLPNKLEGAEGCGRAQVENTHGANTGQWFNAQALSSTAAMDGALRDAFDQPATGLTLSPVD
jgi:hypothetical protein